MTPPAKKKLTMPTPPAKKRKTTAKKPAMPTLISKRKTSATTMNKPTLISPPAKKRRTSATTMNKPAIPPAKKRKTSAPTPTQSTTPIPQSPLPESPLIPSLPYDLLLSCIARVSRLYYPTLSLVSKGFRSLIASPELYKVRSLLGRAESCLYVYIRGYPSRWYTLCLKPDEIIQKKKDKSKSSGYALAAVPDPLSRFAYFHGLVAVGSDIYCIAPMPGSLAQESEPSPVFRLDCRSHTWRPAPSLPVALTPSFSASVVGQKIYLAGTAKDGDSLFKEVVKVFDTETQTWDPLPIPCSSAYGYTTTCIDGKFHVAHLADGTRSGKAVVAYDSQEGRWDMVAPEMADLWEMGLSESYCAIGNVLYTVYDGEMRWYDTEVSKWRKLEGLVGLYKFPPDRKRIRLADYGGKMAVFVDDKFYSAITSANKRYWCAVISLEKRKNCEIWGEVEWVDHVLARPSEEVVKVLAATL